MISGDMPEIIASNKVMVLRTRELLVWIPGGRSGNTKKLDVAVEDIRDVREGVVETLGKVAHAGDRTEGDQSDHESILNQVLTFFALDHGLHCNVHLDHQTVHS